MGQREGLRVRVLGRLEVLGPSGWTTPTATLRRRTLAALALTPGRTVGTDRIADALWRDEVPATADKVVQNHIAALRRELGRPLVETRPGGYALAGDVTTDAMDYVRLVEGAGTALAGEQIDGALTDLDTAASLWRGDPFPDLDGWPMAVGEVARLTELHCEAVEHRLDALVASGRAADAVPALEVAVAEEALRERRWELLMLALYRTGRQTEALRAYGRVRDLLRDELGIDPGPALRGLERAILTQDPSLDAAAGGSGVPPRHALAMARRGEAQRLAGDERHWVTLYDAAQLALETGDDEALFAAALGGVRRTSPRGTSQVDTELVGIIEAALVRVTDDAMRARLLSALGQELSHLPDPTRARRANDDALAIARRTGDAAIISEVLARRPAAFAGPDLLAERLAATEENVRLVAHVDDPLARWGALYARIGAAMELGDIDEVDRCTVALRVATEASDAEPARWGLLITEAWQLLLHGEIEAAERSALTAFDHGTANAQPDALGIYVGQIVGVRRAQGRLLELEAATLASLEQPPMGPTSRPLTAEMLADMGRLDEARTLMDAELATSISEAPGAFTLTILCAWSTVAVRLGELEVAELLRARLTPHRGRVCFNASYVVGAVDLYEGLLAGLLGDSNGADVSLRAAKEIHERIRAPLLAARADVALERLR